MEYGEHKAESQYVPLTEEQVKAMAMDIVQNGGFGSWMIPESQQNLLSSIFMPLMFISDLQSKELIRDKIAHFYAPMKDALPRSINGFPMFASMKPLTQNDAVRVNDKVMQIDKMLKDI